MSTETIFLYAVAVFLLMLIGIVLTILEFRENVYPQDRSGVNHAPIPGKQPAGVRRA